MISAGIASRKQPTIRKTKAMKDRPSVSPANEAFTGSARMLESSAMTRRYRLAVTILTLAMHLLAPIGARAAIPPTTASGDYCSGTVRTTVASDDHVLVPPSPAAANSGVPAPHPTHSPHSHCPSCPVVSLAIAIPGARTSLAVNLPAPVFVAAGPIRADTANPSALLPPLRGPPPIPL
jgi:hypothetical protein